MKSSAVISECQRYRYSLTRQWDESGSTLGFVMLNPSTADGEQDDPTIRKCIGFAQRLGFGAIRVVNLFAYRATDPQNLKAAGYLVGEENDAHIERAAREVGALICAWGSNAKNLSRPLEVMRLIKVMGIQPKALKINSGGIPAHPLMLPYTCQPTTFN